ncbi:hypothetical protein EPN95_02280 [Patescibacteria group bacterium]|nr:MAG: hypothetical protein EPN95_02280 [Patescibacteria group bacterium]
MKKQPPTETKDEVKPSSTEPPAPEVLKAQDDEPKTETSSTESREAVTHRAKPLMHRVTYRPSHKATFIGVAVVVAILGINAIIIAFVVQGQSSASAQGSQSDVTISPAVLDTLGVSRNSVGDLGTQLVVSPNAKFNGTVTIGSDVSIGGALKLNGTLSVANAALTSLQAGNTSLNKLDVNGDVNASNLTLRQNLAIAGTTTLQGAVTAGQSMTVAGNLTVGGALSVRLFQASSLTSETTLTIGGHVITKGLAPGLSGGGALGSNGTVSISGNDASGTVAVNIGTGAVSGVLASISFNTQYSSTPHVIVTPVGRSPGDFYINRTSTGFSIIVSSGLTPGGYAFDYIVEQ